jgi:hypothetical protein
MKYLVILYVLWRFSQEIPDWYEYKKRCYRTVPHWIAGKVFWLDVRLHPSKYAAAAREL